MISRQTLTTFVPTALLGLGVLLISGMREQYTMKPAVPLATVSNEFFGVSGKEIVVDSAERKVAGMSDYVMREFGHDTATGAFSIYVGFYDKQVQGKTIHSPKNCLPGAGWEILSSSPVKVPNSQLTGQVNRVLLANKGTRALVYYWYQGRGRIESNEYKVKWNLLRDAALYGRTEESLVRVVVPIAPSTKVNDVVGVAAADAIAVQVAAKLAVDVARIMPVAPNS